MSSRDAAVSSLVLARLALLAELWSLALLIQFCKNFSKAVQMSFYNCAISRHCTCVCQVEVCHAQEPAKLQGAGASWLDYDVVLYMISIVHDKHSVHNHLHRIVVCVQIVNGW